MAFEKAKNGAILCETKYLISLTYFHTLRALKFGGDYYFSYLCSVKRMKIFAKAPGGFQQSLESDKS
jgi:hypothetical protein